MKGLAVFCDGCGCFLRKANERDAVKHATGDDEKDLCGLCRHPIEPNEYAGSDGELRSRFRVSRR